MVKTEDLSVSAVFLKIGVFSKKKFDATFFIKIFKIVPTGTLERPPAGHLGIRQLKGKKSK